MLLVEDGTFVAAQRLQDALAKCAKCLIIETGMVRADNWKVLTSDLKNVMREQGIRQTSIVAIGAAGTLALNMCLLDAKLVRVVALIDSAMRPHSTLLTRCADWLEQFLPLGLPLRLRTSDFDARSLMQRVRCPVLLVTTPQASEYLLQQSREMSLRFPTAWQVELSEQAYESKLSEIIVEFYEVPARAPQRRGKSEEKAPSP